MEKNRELPADLWVDERLATLSPENRWQPNTTKGFVRFRELRHTGRRRRWVWGVAAAAAASLSLIAALPAPRVFAERCLNYCSAALSLDSSTSNPTPVNAKTKSDHQMGEEAGVLLMGLDGTDVTLEQYKGKVVLVNFWATWCQPCRVEIPWLIEFNERFGPRGLVILGVAMDDEGKKVVGPWIKNQAFQVDGHPELMNYPILLGNEQIADKFGGMIGLPTSFLYGRDGKKIKTIFGVLNHDDLQKAIESQL
jgi:cytochrome c biogenesis protein CcmG/thiol:disulfide interchange protein DsbE